MLVHVCHDAHVWGLGTFGISSLLPLCAGFCGGCFLPAELWHQRVPWLLIENKQHKKPPSTSLLTHPSSPKTQYTSTCENTFPASKSGRFHSAHRKSDSDAKQLELRVPAKRLKWLHHFGRLGNRSLWHFDAPHRGWPLCCVFLDTDLAGPTPPTLGLAEPRFFL